MATKSVRFLSARTKHGAEVILRPLEREDLKNCQRWMSDPYTRERTLQLFPMCYESEEEWYEKNVKARASGIEKIVFAVCVEDTHIGNVGIHDISWSDRHGELGIVLGEEAYRGQGVGKTAYDALIHYAFTELNLERLKAEVYGSNVPSQKLHLACGFVEAGCLSDWMFKGGKYQNMITFQLSRTRWQELQTE